MSNMHPQDMDASTRMNMDGPKNSKITSSMNPKNLANRPREQIDEMARESSQETLQGDFASMDAFMQRDSIETMNDDQKAKEANQESHARQRGSHMNVKDVPEEINTMI